MPVTTSDQEVIYFTPADAPAVLASLIALLDGAKQTVVVMMYGFDHPDLVDALCRAHQRGVDVRCIFDYTQSRGIHEVGMLHRLLLTLPAANIRVGTSPTNHALLHLKALTVDSAVVAEGSLNWSPSALQQVNDLAISQSPAKAGAYTQLFEDTWTFVNTHEPQYQPKAA